MPPLFSLRLPISHPHVTQTFHLLADRCVLANSADNATRDIRKIYSVAVADKLDFLTIDQPESRLGVQIREYAELYLTDTVLAIDGATEGWPFDEIIFAGLHRGLSALAIPAKKVVIISTNYNLPVTYAAWARSSGLDPINFYIYDFWCYKISAQLHEKHIGKEPNSIRASEPSFQVEKKVLSFNRMPKAHRASVVLKLLQDDQLESSLVSFMPDSANVSEDEKASLLTYYKSLGWPALDKLLDSWDALASRIPLVHDQDAGIEYLTYVFGDIVSPDYDKVGFTVITESDFGVADVDRVTEKPFKAIANRCPFLLVGQPNQLARLEKLGFKPYSMFNNEYDLIVEPSARLEAVMNELGRLSTASVEQLQSMRSKMHAVAVYNFNHLIDFGSSDCIDVVARDLSRIVKLAAM
jgi:hypothetical protein